MAKGENITTKFKVDISELKSSMQEARRQTALANSEFKLATSTMDDWSKSSEGIKAKLKQLDTTLESQIDVCAEYKLTLEKIKKEYGENSKEAQEYQIKLNNQQAAINKTVNEMVKLEAELEDVAKAEEIAAKNNSDVVEELKKLKDEANEVGDSANKVSEGFTVMKGAISSLIADGIRGAIDTFKELVSVQGEASSMFQAATGTAIEDMKEYNDAIESIYKNNFGDSLQDVAEKMLKVKEVTGEMDASKLQEMTESALTLEDTFGMDMTETLRGAQSLVNHFGISASEAFDLMTVGAQNGLNYTDELGDNISEYAGKFAEAGYSVEEYFQLLKNGADGGAYNLDKVNDSINEVTARLADGTIGDSISSFSKETQGLFKAWQNGEATQKQVIDSIVNDIRNTTGEQEKMNLAAKAFGTMAEDGGTQFIQSLDTIGTAFEDTKGKMEDIKQVRYDNVTSSLEGLGRTIKLDLISPLVQELIPYIKEAINWAAANLPAITEKVRGIATNVRDFIEKLKELSEWIPTIAAAIGSLGLAVLIGNIKSVITAIVGVIKVTKLWTTASAAFNAVMNANPIMLVITILATLVAAFITAYKTNDEFRAKVDAAFLAIKETISNVVNGIVTFFTETIPNAFKTALDWIKNNWQGLLLFLVNPIAGGFKLIYDNSEKFRAFIDNFVANIKAFFTEKIPEIINNIVEWFHSLPEKIGFALGFVIGKFIKWGIDLVTWIATNVPIFIENVVTFFKELPSKIWTWLTTTITKVAEWGAQMKTKAIETAKTFVENAITFIKELPSKIWTWLVNVITKLTQWKDDMGKKGKEAIKELIDKVIEGAKSIPDKMATIGKDIVDGVWQGIQNAKDQFFENVKGFFSGLVDGAKAALDINSPSKVFAKEIGRWIPEGIAVGIDANADSALKSIKSLSAEMVGSARAGLVTGGVTGSGASVVYNFNQTNNSPKALSRLEIYRQSKNLLGYAGGV